MKPLSFNDRDHVKNGFSAVPRVILLFGCCFGALACDSDTATDATTATSDAIAMADATPDEPTADTDSGVPEDLGDVDLSDTAESPWPAVSIEVAEDACCLAISASRVLWSQAGDIWMHDSLTRQTRVLVGAEGTQTQPTIDGDRVVWADDRNGDFDLYTLDLPDEAPRPLVEAPGDQIQPSLHDDVLVWIDTRGGQHTPLDAEVYMWALGEVDSEPTPLTDDDSEQTHPYVHQGRIVWTDYSADPDRQHIEGTNPNDNNGDIIGYDIGTELGFVVTRDPGKQTRAVVFEDTVVWLDWRSIQPEPKYHRFWIYTGSIVDGGETRIAEAGLAAPDLQIRPSVGETHVLWLGLIPTTDGEFEEGQAFLFAASLDGSDPLGGRILEGGSYQAAVLRHGLVAAVGAGRLDVRPLSALLQEGD